MALLQDTDILRESRPAIIFSRVARRAIEAGTAHEIVAPSHVMPAERYLERLVLELADQYAKRGEGWFRAQYKEHLS